MQVDCIFEQGTGVINEDYCCVEDNLFGVFDGATSLSKSLFEPGVTGGYLASNIAGEVFRHNHASLLTLVDSANSAILDAMLKKGVDPTDKENLWSTSAAVVRLYDDRFEWVQTGDSLVMVIYDNGTYEIVTQRPDQDLETLQLWKEVANQTDDTLMSALHDQIRKVRAQANITYGVLNGEQEALRFINHGRKSLEGIKNILLFTDGLFIPKEDPKDKGDFSLFSTLFQNGGLTRVRDYIRELEETDMGCRVYPRFKPHDDIAAISLTL